MSMEKPPSNNLLTFEEGHSKIFMPFFFWLWLGNKRVAFWKGLPVYFFCSKSRLIPCRMASPRDIPCIVQYSCNLAAVSWSSRIVRLIPFGLSALGRPVRGDISSPHFLPCIKYIYARQKAKWNFRFFSSPHTAFLLSYIVKPIRGRSQMHTVEIYRPFLCKSPEQKEPPDTRRLSPFTCALTASAPHSSSVL